MDGRCGVADPYADWYGSSCRGPYCRHQERFMSSSSAPNLPPADLGANARTVLEKRYLMRDGAGQVIETPEQMFFRVAHVLASVEARYGADAATVAALTVRFYTLMAERRFEPNSPTFTGAGRGHGQLSACFVLPIDDTLKNGQS